MYVLHVVTNELCSTLQVAVNINNIPAIASAMIHNILKQILLTTSREHKSVETFNLQYDAHALAKISRVHYESNFLYYVTWPCSYSLLVFVNSMFSKFEKFLFCVSLLLHILTQ